MRTLLVGEVNPYGSDPMFALYPIPRNASGARLARIFGMRPSEYLAAFDRVNLCSIAWSMSEARERAAGITLKVGAGQWGKVVLLGRRVAEAFGFRDSPVWSVRGPFVLLPHPSGRCLLWNEMGATARAYDLVLGGGDERNRLQVTEWRQV